MAIACIVLIFVCGIGALVAFIYGWMNATEWGIKNIMLIWTVCFVVSLVRSSLAYSMLLPQIQNMPGPAGNPFR